MLVRDAREAAAGAVVAVAAGIVFMEAAMWVAKWSKMKKIARGRMVSAEQAHVSFWIWNFWSSL